MSDATSCWQCFYTIIIIIIITLHDLYAMYLQLYSLPETMYFSYPCTNITDELIHYEHIVLIK